jgi:hypothetical protein
MPSMRGSEEVVSTATTPTIVFTSTVQPRPGSRSPGHSPCMSPARASWPFAMRSPNRAAPPCGRHRQRPAQGRPVVLTTHAGRGVTYTEDARRTRRHTRRLGPVWYMAPSGSNGRRWGRVRQHGARSSRCSSRADHGGGRRRGLAVLDGLVGLAAAAWFSISRLPPPVQDGGSSSSTIQMAHECCLAEENARPKDPSVELGWASGR